MEHTLFTISFALFLLMDPIGNIPIYIAVLKKFDPKKQLKIIIRELIIALGVIILFTFMGEHLLKILNVGQETVRIAGGIILFMIALKMIFPSDSGSYGTEGVSKADPFIVPLAIPLIAGPSVLAAVIIYSNHQSSSVLISAICIAWTVSAFILMISPLIKKILDERVITACERLMGLLLTLMAIQMFLEGVTLFMDK